MWLLGGYTLNYFSCEFSFYEDNGYDRLEAPGYVLGGEPGTPELPVDIRHYIIPADAHVESIITVTLTMTQMSGSYSIYPAQPPHVFGESIPWVEPDTLIYGSDSLYPGVYVKTINQGIMDGARIATIGVYPLQYRPQSERLFLVEEISFDFSTSTIDLPELRPQIRGEYEQAIYDAALTYIVSNDHEIPAYYAKPLIVKEKNIDTIADTPGAPGVIITSYEFISAFQPYADWMRDQGIPTVIVQPNFIYAYFDGRDNAEKIRNYIKWCYGYKGGTYFILAGDCNYPPGLPCRKCFCFASFSYMPNNVIPCDYYFSALDGDWNFDGDTIWGEFADSVDHLSEVFVGRIPNSSTLEASNWCRKALCYEMSPGNVSSLDTVIWIWENGPYPNKWYMGDTTIFPDHFTHLVAENFDAQSAFQLFDHGYMFTNVQTHGHVLGFWPNGNAPCSIKSHMQPPPDWWGAGLNHLANDDRYFVNYCVGCKTGAFDWNDTCVADAFVDAYTNPMTGMPVGACASIEHSRASFPNTIWLQNKYYEVLFALDNPESEEHHSMIGFALAGAKAAAPWDSAGHWQFRWNSYNTNLFGSPVTAAWTRKPKSMRVSHPDQIPCNAATHYTVLVTTATHASEPLQHAKVCLNKPSDIYEVGSTDANGMVVFTIDPETAGTMKVTVTRAHNIESDYAQYLPSQTECEVVVDTCPPSAPYVGLVVKSVNDVLLTWSKITTDALGKQENMHCYIVYCDTTPSFVPDSSNSIGCVFHPDTTYLDSSALTDVKDYYYLIKSVDWADNKSNKSNMGYMFHKFVNEN